jgi:general secretion pathway protein F
MFAYKGIAASGKAVAGVRDAESPKALRSVLRRDGVTVTSCEVSKKAGAGKAAASARSGLSKEVDLGGIFGGVKKAEVAAFTRQLATLLRAGIPLAECLGALYEQNGNVRFKVPLGEVRTAVNEGSTLADAMGKHPKLFDELYVSMVRAGEVAGNLDEVLRRLAEFLEGAQRLKGKVQGAMVYPVIMLAVGLVIMTIMMVVVIPQITSMFKQQGKVLPLNTRMLIASSDFFRGNWLLLMVLAVVGGYAFARWSKSETGRPRWHGVILRMPMAGDIIRQLSVSRFSRTLGTMLSSGVPMLRALETSKEILRNVVLRRAVEDAKKAVTEGESLAATLKKSGQFPATMIHMVAVGERAGQLENMLQQVAETYESEVDMKLSRLTSALEPLMLVVMGGTVAFVVFSVLQPIMDMGQFGTRK